MKRAVQFDLTFGLLTLFAGATLFFSSQPTFAETKIGKPAPDFTLVDSQGKTHSLKNYQGKLVVLEWFNDECPFVRKYYDSGTMQKIQADETAKGVIWLTVISSAKGKPAFKGTVRSTAILLDTDGKVGKTYEAKTTPHLFVINQKGELIYRGAIDDQPTTDGSDLAKAKNYVTSALSEVRSGKKVTFSDTKPYGCGVKYR